MSDNLYAEYNAVIGSVIAARNHYDDLCLAQGKESEAAQQAHNSLEQEIEHRDDMRRRYDAATRRRGAH